MTKNDDLASSVAVLKVQMQGVLAENARLRAELASLKSGVGEVEAEVRGYRNMVRGGTAVITVLLAIGSMWGPIRDWLKRELGQ